MADRDVVRDMDKFQPSIPHDWSPCVEGTLTNTAMPQRTHVEAIPGAVIYADVAHMNASSIGGARYFVNFIDEACCRVRTFHLKSKSEAAELLECQVSWIERRSGCMVKRIVLDDSREYDRRLKDLFMQGIEVSPTSPNTPQESGRAERKNHTIKNGIRTLLIQTSVPASFLAECLCGVCDACSSVVRLGCPKTPEDLLTGVKQNVGHLQIFGGKVWARVHDK